MPFTLETDGISRRYLKHQSFAETVKVTGIATFLNALQVGSPAVGYFAHEPTKLGFQDSAAAWRVRVGTGGVEVLGTATMSGGAFYPSRADSSWAAQSSYYLASHASFGIQANTGFDSTFLYLSGNQFAKPGTYNEIYTKGSWIEFKAQSGGAHLAYLGGTYGDFRSGGLLYPGASGTTDQSTYGFLASAYSYDLVANGSFASLGQVGGTSLVAATGFVQCADYFQNTKFENGQSAWYIRSYRNAPYFNGAGNNSWTEVVNDFGIYALWGMAYVGTTHFYIASDGNMHIDGTDYYHTSDLSAKQNIERIDGARLRRLRALRPSHFTNRRDEHGPYPERRHLGFIAQDLEVVLPEAVSDASENPNGTRSIALTPLVALLTASLQDVDREQVLDRADLDSLRDNQIPAILDALDRLDSRVLALQEG